jgi:putative tricarboxylic transport membrane protein
VKMGNKKRDKLSGLSHFLKVRARTRDFYLAIVLLIFCLVLLFYVIPFHVQDHFAKGMAVKPSFFPYGITLALLVLSLLLVYNSPKTALDVSRIEDKRITRMTFVFVGLLFACYLAIVLFGMLPASVMTVLVLMRIFGYTKWFRALIFSLIFVALLFLFFEKIAQVSIPRGIFFEDLY